jgi:hypothetical protein
MKCSYKTASQALVQLMDRVPLLSVGNAGDRCRLIPPVEGVWLSKLSRHRWGHKRILEEDLSDGRLVIKLG